MISGISRLRRSLHFATIATIPPQRLNGEPNANGFHLIDSTTRFVFVLIFLFYGLQFLDIPSVTNTPPKIGSNLGMSRRKAILYHTNWANYGRDFQVKDIPLDGITDIAYAFFNLKDAGNGRWVIVSGD